MSDRETTHVRIHKDSLKKLWDLVNSDNRTLADVISFLIDFYEEKSKPNRFNLEEIGAKTIA